MDLAAEDLWNQKIKELVYDEEEIITCISLAITLKVSLKKAKNLLTSFVADARKLKHEDLHVNYMMSGDLKDGTGVAIYLVTESDLNNRKTLFDTIFEEFVYSIKKKHNLNVVSFIDKLGHFGFFDGVITSKNCVKKDIKKTEIRHLTPSEIPKKNELFLKKVLVDSEIKESKQKISQSLKYSQDKQFKRNQSSIFANYFSKNQGKTNKNSNDGGNVVENGDLIKSEPGNVMASQEKVNESNDKTVIKRENSECEKKDNAGFNKDYAKAEIKSKKRKKGAKSENIVNKKRKRIQEVCDSDSSDIFDDMRDEDIIEKSDEEDDTVPVVQTVSLQTIKNRKAVDEVYMDEDGYMVTTTKYIYESVPEDKEEQQIQKKKDASSEKKCPTDLETNKVYNSNNKNKKASGKQTTLINFFKKP